jgi:type VI secretion system protein ImpG
VKAPTDDLLRYYLDELSYVRQMGVRFARDYPKVAARLELQPDECPDPHVERMIEAFAFLTARIQSDLDSDFPQIAHELLDVLYPHYLNPIPSMTIARFVVDTKETKLTSGFELAKHTRVFTTTERGDVVRFRTCYPATIWPVAVTEVEMQTPESLDFIDAGTDAAAVLRVRLETASDPFETLDVDSLRFYLHGEPVLVSRLYELLFDSTLRIAVCPAGEKAPRYLPNGSVTPVGFGIDDEVVPYPRQSHPAYRLLQEYFSFPEKFHFVDLGNLRGRATGKSVDVYFLLDRMPRTKLLLTPETFALGCTPVVNLFNKTSDPIRIDHRQIEYRLVPDMRKEMTTEIHSIVSVSGSSDVRNGTREYVPFYAYTHAMKLRDQKAFWHSRRAPSQREDTTGTEMFLSFRDNDFNPADAPDEIVFAHLLCTNRALAAELPSGATLQSDEALPVAEIVCLKKPTRPISPPLGGQTLWRLISHLSLNFLSLTEEKESLEALHEILGLYCFSDAPSLRQQISGIRSMAQRKVVRRLNGADWRGFCRGTEVDLTFDDRVYVGSSAFLLASVLRHYFGLYASVNSFTQLVIRRDGGEGIWKRWPPMAGASAVL